MKTRLMQQRQSMHLPLQKGRPTAKA